MKTHLSLIAVLLLVVACAYAQAPAVDTAPPTPAVTVGQPVVVGGSPEPPPTATAPPTPAAVPEPGREMSPAERALSGQTDDHGALRTAQSEAEKWRAEAEGLQKRLQAALTPKPPANSTPPPAKPAPVVRQYVRCSYVAPAASKSDEWSFVKRVNYWFECTWGATIQRMREAIEKLTGQVKKNTDDIGTLKQDVAALKGATTPAPAAPTTPAPAQPAPQPGELNPPAEVPQPSQPAPTPAAPTAPPAQQAPVSPGQVAPATMPELPPAQGATPVPMPQLPATPGVAPVPMPQMPDMSDYLTRTEYDTDRKNDAQAQANRDSYQQALLTWQQQVDAQQNAYAAQISQNQQNDRDWLRYHGGWMWLFGILIVLTIVALVVHMVRGRQ